LYIISPSIHEITRFSVEETAVSSKESNVKKQTSLSNLRKSPSQNICIPCRRTPRVFYRHINIPYFVLCTSCFSEGIFPISMRSRDFIRVQIFRHPHENLPPELYFEEKDWSEEDLLRLLEAIDTHPNDWDAVSKSLSGFKTPEQCLQKFLQIPILPNTLEKENAVISQNLYSDNIEENTIASTTDTILKEEVKRRLLIEESFISDCDNPLTVVLGVILRSLNHGIAAAGAKSALKLRQGIPDEFISEYLGRMVKGAGDNNHGNLLLLADVALLGAVNESKRLALDFDNDIVRIIGFLTSKQLEKLNAKLEILSEFETK
jgi:hypothetical protein